MRCKAYLHMGNFPSSLSLDRSIDRWRLRAGNSDLIQKESQEFERKEGYMHRIIIRMQLDLYDCSSWRQSSGCGSVSISIAHQQYLYSSSSFLAMRRRRRTCRPLMIRVDKDAKAAAVAMENKDQLRRRGVRKCECHDLYDVLVPYTDAWKWQKFLVEGRSATLETKADLVDSVAILQHPSVYTMGTRSSERFLHFDKQSPPFELHRTERGGEVTYHGPGQVH